MFSATLKGLYLKTNQQNLMFNEAAGAMHTCKSKPLILQFQNSQGSDPQRDCKGHSSSQASGRGAELKMNSYQPTWGNESVCVGLGSQGLGGVVVEGSL